MTKITTTSLALLTLFLGACTQPPAPSLQDTGVVEMEDQPDQDQAVSSMATEDNTEGMLELDENEGVDTEDQGDDEGFEDSADDFAGGDGALYDVPVVTTRNVKIDSKDWSFNPANITASLGEGVIFELSGTSEDYGFAIPELNVIETVPANEKIEFLVPTNVIGTFEFFCTFPCDENGTEMSGELVIEE